MARKKIKKAGKTAGKMSLKKATAKGNTKGKAAARKMKSNVKSKGKPRYICYTCGTEVSVDDYGAGFSELICCDRVMQKKR